MAGQLSFLCWQHISGQYRMPSNGGRCNKRFGYWHRSWGSVYLCTFQCCPDHLYLGCNCGTGFKSSQRHRLHHVDSQRNQRHRDQSNQ